MISAEGIYNQIVANIEKDLPIAIRSPRKATYRRAEDSGASAESSASATGTVTAKGVTATEMHPNVKAASFESALKAITGEVTSTVSPSSVASGTGTVSERIEAAVQLASKKYGIEQYLIKGVIQAESSFNPTCRSSVGAQGLMQLMPGTAAGLGVTDAYNIEQNIDGGTKYLRQMLDKFDNDIKLALAAYNAGPGNVAKYGGIPPFKETQNYVPRVLKYAESFRTG